MTRMWGIDPRWLCDQHLIGDHAEMHQVVGTIGNHPHAEAVVRAMRSKTRSIPRRFRPATMRWRTK